MKKLTAACMLAVWALAGGPTAAAAQRLPPLAPAPQDALTRALDAGRLTEAGYALERARTLFDLDRVRVEHGRVAAPASRAATAILRDLVLRRPALRGKDAQAAAQILARPGANQSACDATRPLCFHWLNQVSAQDVNATETTFAAVYDLEVETYGFLAPLPDGSRGGNSKTDIYLRDIGPNLFGYCTSDVSTPTPDIHAYCVVDDDFAEFGNSQTPQSFRDVTAAHEYFHAIQFAYDSLEDLWLMEGTAMLMEGEFRPDVDDRIDYLANSALTSPETPVDFGRDGFEYGAWVFWRFLVEQLDELGNPLVIRQIWERAAGASTDTDGPGPDTIETNPYSLQATRSVLSSRGESFRSLFAKFARVNRVPAAFYAEGGSYPRAPETRRRTMSARENTGWRSHKLRHLASVYLEFRPAVGLSGHARLRVVVNLPSFRYRPEASLLVRLRNGDLRTHRIALDSRGNGAKSVGFAPGDVRRVDLVLTNASTRMRCDEGTPYSCAGVGLDDLRAYGYRAVVR
jgi:hypothetical protein